MFERMKISRVIKVTIGRSLVAISKTATETPEYYLKQVIKEEFEALNEQEPDFATKLETAKPEERIDIIVAAVKKAMPWSGIPNAEQIKAIYP